MSNIEIISMGIIEWIVTILGIGMLLVIDIKWKLEARDMDDFIDQILSAYVDIAIVAILGFKLKVDKIVVLPGYTIYLAIIIINVIVALFYLIRTVREDYKL